MLVLMLMLVLMRMRVYCRTWFWWGTTHFVLVNNSLLSRSAAGRRNFGMQQALYFTLFANLGCLTSTIKATFRRIRSGQVRSGQVRSGQVRSGQVKSGLAGRWSLFMSGEAPSPCLADRGIKGAAP